MRDINRRLINFIHFFCDTTTCTIDGNETPSTNPYP
jgi:hypothetical protein